jgi:hypothetical protein
MTGSQVRVLFAAPASPSAPVSMPLLVVPMRSVVRAGTHARIGRPLGGDRACILLGCRCREGDLYGLDRRLVRDIINGDQSVGFDRERRNVFRIKTGLRLGRYLAGQRRERSHADQQGETDQAGKRKPDSPSHHSVRARIQRKKRLSMSGAARGNKGCGRRALRKISVRLTAGVHGQRQSRGGPCQETLRTVCGTGFQRDLSHITIRAIGLVSRSPMGDTTCVNSF